MSNDLYRDYAFGQLIGPLLHRPPNTLTPNISEERAHYLANPHQIFALHYVTPGKTGRPGSDQPQRYYFMHVTGSGKTSLSIRIMSAYLRLPGMKVYILGFDNTREVFIGDAFKFPELGYVSQSEYTHLQHLKSNYYKTQTPLARHELQSFTQRLRTRFNARADGGGVFFYGYQEFANRVGFGETGEVNINESFVASLAPSLFILDEIQHTYNSLGFNNRGLALKHVSEAHKNNIHIIALSATPMNNSSAESVELGSLLNYGPVTRDQYFTGERLTNVAAFEKLFTQRVSVVKDLGMSNYPAKRFAEGSIQLPGCGPDFLFLTCPMTPYQERALVEAKSSNVEDNEDAEVVDFSRMDRQAGAKSNNTYFLRDFALPGTVDPELIEAFRSGKKVTLSQLPAPCITTSDLKLTYPTIPLEFVTEEALKLFSTKYARGIHDIKKMRGKTLIFHPRVEFGIKFVERMMEAAHFVAGDEVPDKLTPCALCGQINSEHKAANQETPHTFAPARFLTVHFLIEKTQQTRIRSIWNTTSNTNGADYQFLLGSQLITVGFDFASIQNLVVFGLPDTYHTLLQLFGRAIRNKSHMNLPPAKRVVTIYNYVNIWGGGQAPHNPPAGPAPHGPPMDQATNNPPEAQTSSLSGSEIYQELAARITPERYIIKYPTYEEINKVTDIFARLAVDKDVYSVEFASTFKASDLDRPLSYYARNLFDDEIANIYRVVKRLFLLQAMWKLPDLLAAVKNPPISVNMDISQCRDETIKFVLKRIIYQLRDRAYLSTVTTFVQNNNQTSCLFNYNAESKFFIKANQVYVVVWAAPFLMLRPVDVINKSIGDELTNRQKYMRYRINLVSDEVTNLLATEKPSYQIWTTYAANIHKVAIEALLAPQSKEKGGAALYAYYVRCGIIRNTEEYWMNNHGYRLIGNNWTATAATRPAYARIMGFYQDQQFKLIDTDVMAEERKDARTATRGTACMNKSQAELQRMASELGLNKSAQRDQICASIEEHLNLMQQKDGGKRTHVLYWGPP